MLTKLTAKFSEMLFISTTITRWRHLFQTGFQFSRAMLGLQGRALYQWKALFKGHLLCVITDGQKRIYRRCPLSNTPQDPDPQHCLIFQDADETDLHRIEIPLEFHILNSGNTAGVYILSYYLIFFLTPIFKENPGLQVLTCERYPKYY